MANGGENSPQTIRLLLVEDDEEDAGLLKRMLAGEREPVYKVRWERDLKSALKAIDGESFDLILTDLSLPDSAGTATFETIHKKTPAVPIVILTGMRDDQLAFDLVSRGAQDFVAKEDLNSRLISSLLRYAIERKKALETARMTQQKYFTIFEHSAAAITVIDHEEKIVSWNKFAEQMLKMGHDDLYMKPVRALYSEIEWQKIRAERVREKGMVHSLETRVIRGDHVVIDVDLSVSVLKDEAGRMTGAVGIMTDISERKRAALELKQAEERYRTIFENSAVAITVTDEHERIVSWNRFAETFLGMNAEDLYRLPVQSLYPEEEWKKIRQLNIRKKGLQEVLETAVWRKDGTLLDVDVSISVLKDASGKITGSIGIMKDITERKRLQQLKDEFVGMVSHELRTPLSIMRESLSQMKDNLLGDTTDRQQRMLGMSLNAIDRLGRIINDLLDLSKIEAQKMSLVYERLELGELVREMVSQFEYQASSKGLQLEASLQESPVYIDADRDRLIQVFTNLISNALKFTDRGRIEISARPRGDGWVECAVSDSGRGIGTENLEKVFSKFEQFGKRVPGLEKGTGLGLSVCKGIVELHGGKIYIESGEGMGARFVFTLPPGNGASRGGPG